MRRSRHPDQVEAALRRLRTCELNVVLAARAVAALQPVLAARIDVEPPVAAVVEGRLAELRQAVELEREAGAALAALAHPPEGPSARPTLSLSS